MKKAIDVPFEAAKLRDEFGIAQDAPVNVLDVVSHKLPNLTLIYYPFSDNISGYCYNGDDFQAIVINSNMTKGRQNFTMAHELYHLYVEKSVTLGNYGDFNNKNDQTEKNADLFASLFLISPLALYKYIKNEQIKLDQFNPRDLIRMSQYFGVSCKAMFYRLTSERLVAQDSIDFKDLQIKQLAAQEGFLPDLYESNSLATKELVVGKYFRDLNYLREQDLITDSRYRNSLAIAFKEYSGDILENGITD